METVVTSGENVEFLTQLRQLSSVEQLLETGVRVISYEPILCTPEMAEEFLVNCKYHKNRPLNRDNARLYEDVIVRGLWVPIEPLTLGRVRGETRWVVMNGQHRCTGILDSKTSVQWNVQRLEFDTQELLDYAYLLFDTQKRRTAQDTMNASGLLEKSGLPASFIGRIESAVRLITANFKHIQSTRHRSDYSLPMQHKMGEAWIEEAVQAHSILSGKSQRMGAVENQGTLAVMLVTLRYQFTFASGFWQSVAHDDTSTKGPDYQLAEFLKERKGHRGGMLVMSRMVAAHWNDGYKQRRGRENQKIDVAEPIVIEGTPYDGK